MFLEFFSNWLRLITLWDDFYSVFAGTGGSTKNRFLSLKVGPFLKGLYRQWKHIWYHKKLLPFIQMAEDGGKPATWSLYIPYILGRWEAVITGTPFTDEWIENGGNRGEFNPLSIRDEISWICKQRRYWWGGSLPYLDLHCLPSSLCILNMIWLGWIFL